MSEIFLQNEDNLNSILVNFKNLLKSFATLSRDKIENILLNANSMIKEGENNLRIMEEEINKLGIQQQFNNKLKNYKLEFQNLQNKFQESQEEYINHKANNAISLGRNENTEELNNQNNELISNNENINNKNKSIQESNISDIFNKVQIQNDSNLHKRFDNDNNVNVDDNNSNLQDDYDFNFVTERNNRLIIIFASIGIILVLVIYFNWFNKFCIVKKKKINFFCKINLCLLFLKKK